MGTAWSARANDALERGLRPAPMIADELGVSAEAVELHMRSPEWHHVGEDYEEVHFYDPDEAPLTDADAVEDAETARSFLRYVEMLNYDTRTFTVKPRVAGRFEAEASDEAYALFTSRGTAVAKEAFEAADEFRALVEKETASAEELRAAAKATLAAAKSGRKKMEAAAKAFLSEHKDWKRARPRRARRGANGLRYSLEEALSATAEEREGIEREAKEKGTWLKAPNGQDTKLTPKQWVTVRTAAFKKWFGDWEKSATLANSFREEDSNANIIRVERDGYTDEFRRIQEESNRLSQEDVAQFHRSSKQLTEDERLALGRVYERLLAGSGNARNDVWTDLTGKGNTFRIARVNGELFHDIFEVNRKYLPNGELVDLHEDYSNAKCFLTDDGMCGFAVEEGGNLVSVFSLNPNKIPERTGFLYAIRDFAREQGATHLDAYASNKQNLEAIYAKTLGFHVAAEMDYAMEYDHDDIAANHGKPKVVFMVDSAAAERRKFDDYDAAVAYQRGATSAANAASKVVDENGEPLVVYRGRRDGGGVVEIGEDGAHFTTSRAYAQEYEERGREVAYGGDAPNTIETFLRVSNPLDLREVIDASASKEDFKRRLSDAGLNLAEEMEYPYRQKSKVGTVSEYIDDYWEGVEELRENPNNTFTDYIGAAAKKSGFDGVVSWEFEDRDNPIFIVFSPEQIKSATENAGTFDAGNPDIRYSRGGDKVLRNSAGVVYGYWDEGSGELHLNEDFADFDTPLHEWAHVWLSWVRKADARKYASSVAFDLAENFLQAANRGEGIVVPADGAHDGKVPRAGAEHGGQPRFVDPADGDGGTRRGVDHRAHGLQAQRRIGNFLGRRGVDGADADVVGSGGTRGSRLRERMRGEPENFQRREAFPCGGQRHVVLPEMHAVGLRFRGDFRIVVHDEERARSRSDAANVFRGFDDAFPRRALHAQLNETQACAHGCVRAGFITRRGIRDDEVKAEGIFHEEKKKKTRERGDCARHPMAFPSSFFSASNLRR